MSGSTFILAAASAAIYGYSAFYMNYDVKPKSMHRVMPKELQKYGNYMFLTYQCLLIQLFSSILHLLAHFLPSLKGLRDLVFGSLAYPIGSFVVITFWAVWHVMGRQYIFPVELEQYYPSWLNHSTHTIIIFINLLFVVTEPYKYARKGVVLTLGYFLFYLAVLFSIKIYGGKFVYPYLEVLDNMQRALYFTVSTVFALLLYWKGRLLNAFFHQANSAKRVHSKKGKQS